MHPARRHRFAFALGAVLLSAAACGDSTSPNSALTPGEASELALQMGAHFSTGLSRSALSARAGGPLLNAIPLPFSGSITANVPCPAGGSTRLSGNVSGTIEESTQSFTANVSATNSPDECGYPVHGKTIFTTGSLTATAHVEIKNGVPVGAQTATLVGEFSWHGSDGRKGNCTVNYTASANYTSNVATVNGNFCGSTIQFTGPLTS